MFKRIEIKKVEPARKSAPFVSVNVDRLPFQPKDINVPQLQPNIVKWDQDDYQEWVRMKTDVMYNRVGFVCALDSFNPFGENKFCLYVMSDQTEYAKAHAMARVIMLREDLSPDYDKLGKDRIDMVQRYRLIYIGVDAIGEMNE